MLSDAVAAIADARTVLEPGGGKGGQWRSRSAVKALLDGKKENGMRSKPLIEALVENADRDSEQLALRFLADGDIDGRVVTLTRGQFLSEAVLVASALRARGVKPQERVLLLYLLSR